MKLYRNPVSNHTQSGIIKGDLNITTSRNVKKQSKEVKNNKEQDIIFVPLYPTFLPNNPQIKKLNRGSKIMFKYIKSIKINS